MAGVVTELPGAIDEVTIGGVRVTRRKFQYVRAIGDDEAIIVTPTTGDAVALKRGLIEAPWASIISISASNLSAAVLTPVAPVLNMSLDRGPPDITNNVSEGEIVDVLAGEDRAWPVTFPTSFPEQVRCFPVGTQAAGGRTYWLSFASENAKAATWEFTLQCMEAA